ncbi:hypothetical protein [Streptomyces sp. NPDC057302]|uniref:hypothetical protein n=1 Tax=Streptomyces sp. NPDC057302 TaxID=3346094 RepID=UPI0036275CD1
MNVGRARSAAVQWVAQHAQPDAGYRGAYFSGSTVGLPDDAELPPSSDVDIFVVTAADSPPVKPGKLPYQGALLEVSYLPWAELASAEEVLASYHLAGSFRSDTVIDDPTGHLRTLHAHVSPRFAARPWVRRRCQDARHRIEARLAAIDTSAPFHEQVNAWLFPTGVTCHVLLAAALRNPTVRLRYPAARKVLADYGHLSLYPELLRLLGCSHLAAHRVQHHLRELAATFDATAEVARTPYFFSSDITPPHGRSPSTEARASLMPVTIARRSSGSSRPSPAATPSSPSTLPPCTRPALRPSGQPSPTSASAPATTSSAEPRTSPGSCPGSGRPARTSWPGTPRSPDSEGRRTRRVAGRPVRRPREPRQPYQPTSRTSFPRT